MRVERKKRNARSRQWLNAQIIEFIWLIDWLTNTIEWGYNKMGSDIIIIVFSISLFITNLLLHAGSELIINV